jgi:hypothetical protein
MTLFAAALVAISTVAGVRCFDVRTVDGGCLVSQQVAVVWRYGEIHGAFVANDFPHGAGLVVGATFGGDVGSPWFHFRHDRLRLAARLTVDGGVIERRDVGTRSSTFDFDALTFSAGPQLWVRISPGAFFVARAAAGASVFIFDVFPNGGTWQLTPTIDAAVGFAFDLF